MAPHSSTLVWKIPWTEEPVRLQSVGSLGVGVRVQESPPFESLCREEAPGNVESPFGETRLDELSAGRVSFPRRMLFS